MRGQRREPPQQLVVPDGKGSETLLKVRGRGAVVAGRGHRAEPEQGGPAQVVGADAYDHVIGLGGFLGHRELRGRGRVREGLRPENPGGYRRAAASEVQHPPVLDLAKVGGISAGAALAGRIELAPGRWPW